MKAVRIPPRIGSVDLVRGLALIGMIVFHGAWDLHAFGITNLDPSLSPAWHGFGHAVAGCFLFLSGFSLVLAKNCGATTRSMLKRIGMITTAALVVTFATWFVAPKQVIVFGILHCIALSNVIALGMLLTPTSLMVLVALAAFAAPLALEPIAPTWTWWIGLSDTVPDTLDFRPLCPWLGTVLLGCLFARHGGIELMSGWGTRRGRPIETLRVAGRHSLTIYLAHQPIMLALLLSMTALSEGSTTREGSQFAFTKACFRECVEAGGGRELCEPACQCVSTRNRTRHSKTLQGTAGGRVPLSQIEECLVIPERTSP